MGKNKAICNTVSAEKPGDAELSRQLGRYQKQARIWLRVGLIGIAGGVISFFAVHDAALKALFVTVLFFGGTCCVLFLSSGAQKKIKSIFTMALETDYGFASVASDVDLRDLDAVRGSYIASLQEMGRTLDLLLKNTALFAGQKRERSGNMSGIILILILVLLIAFWCVSTVNGFKKKEIRVQEGLSGVEVALAKRYDMLTKMLDTAKGYMKHENEMFTKVTALRRGMSVGELNAVKQQMDTLSGKLFAVAEGYPELRSSEAFVELQRGIRDAEEHLQAARRLYNANVTAYNTAIAMFPAKLLAGGRQAKEFFAVDETKREDVKMMF